MKMIHTVVLPCCAAILFLFSQCALGQTTTTGGGGPGGSESDPLAVKLFATSETLVVGYQVDLTAEASGGKPRYAYGFSLSCNVDVPAAIKGNVWKYASSAHTTFDLPQPGKLKALAIVLDQNNKTSFGEKVITIQPPDNIKLVDPVVSVRPVGNKLLVARHTFKFEVRKGTKIIGPSAIGLGQEKVQRYDLKNKKWDTKWTAWKPNQYAPEFHFRAGTIYDRKAMGIDKDLWRRIPDRTVLKKFRQQVKFVYRYACQEKNTKNKELVSKVYVVTITKKDGKFKWSHVIESD